MFVEDMDQTTAPPVGDFVIWVDGMDKTPITAAWTGARNFTLTYSETVLGPSVVRTRFATKNPLFLSVLGELVTPFDILITAP